MKYQEIFNTDVPLFKKIEREINKLSKIINKQLQLDYNCCRIKYNYTNDEDSLILDIEIDSTIFTFKTNSLSITFHLDSIINIIDNTIKSKANNEKEYKDNFFYIHSDNIPDLCLLTLEKIYVRD